MIDLFAPRGRYGKRPAIADRIDATGDCWEWTGAKSNGYGRVSIGTSTKNVHNVVWEALMGPIPEGLELDHLCRNRACCNPDHLEPVTRAENKARGYSPLAKHARKTRCPQGHPYSNENTYRKPTGGRTCRTCHREAVKRKWRQAKATKRGQR